MTEKKQAVMLRIPGLAQYSPDKMQEIALTVQKTLQQHFDKEVVVLVFNEDIHFMTESDIRDMIDTLENIIK